MKEPPTFRWLPVCLQCDWRIGHSAAPGGRADFVSNWVWHLDKIGVGNFLVGAMDEQLLQRLASEGVPAFSMASGLTTEDFGWCAARPTAPTCTDLMPQHVSIPCPAPPLQTLPICGPRCRF